MLMSDELIWGGGGRFVFGCYLGLVMSHFVVNTGVWRLSGSFQRQYSIRAFRLGVDLIFTMVSITYRHTIAGM